MSKLRSQNPSKAKSFATVTVIFLLITISIQLITELQIWLVYGKQLLLKGTFQQQLTNDDPREDMILIYMGHQTFLKAEICVTEKGNGRIKIGGLDIRFRDNHDDTVLYQKGLVTFSKTDLDNNGYHDFRLTGTVLFTPEQDIGEVKPALFTSRIRFDDKQCKLVVQDLIVDSPENKERVRSQIFDY